MTPSRARSYVTCSPTPGQLLTGAHQSPAWLMPVWVGLSVTFHRRNQISGSKISCLLSGSTALSHVCETRRATAFKTEEMLSFQGAEEHHPGFRGTPRRRGEWEKSREGQRAAVRVAKRLFHLRRGAEVLSGAAVWVTSIILMTLQPSYVVEAPPTFSKV